jgi:hypothetical protein
MIQNRKVIIIFLSFVLAMSVIACSFGTLAQTPTVAPKATQQETMPGLAGKWQDPETTDTFVIAWQDGQYVVTSVTWGTNTYSITSQSWDGSSLTWTYYDTDLPMSVTYSTTSISGDNLYVDWSYTDGKYGNETLSRVP